SDRRVQPPSVLEEDADMGAAVAEEHQLLGDLITNSVARPGVAAEQCNPHGSPSVDVSGRGTRGNRNAPQGPGQCRTRQAAKFGPTPPLTGARGAPIFQGGMGA